LRDRLNYFHKLTPEDRAELVKTCGWIHEKFIDHVKKHRGAKLKKDSKMFTGEIYSGVEAVEEGLVDEVGTMVEVLEKLYPGSKLDIPKSRSWLSTALRAC
jgi:serine protease SohB